MLIFGSIAVKHWFPDYRIPNDLDIISRDDYWISAFEYLETHNVHSQYVDPDFLYTIKVSHAAWPIHWDKTMHDVVFLKNHGCKLNKEFYDLLIPCWIELHGKKRVNLNTSNDDFFTSLITRKYTHDYLHEQLAFYDRPLHEKIRKDLNSPASSEELFCLLSDEDKIKCALEEIYVFMYERFLIPEKTKSYKHAKYKAMRLLITSASTGWFNRFIIENFETLIYYEDDLCRHKHLLNC